MNLKVLEPIINLIPEIQQPTVKPKLKSRLKWTLFALIIFAILGIINPIGAPGPGNLPPHLQSLQYILASEIGTLATLGIGPIVMSSIILQLLAGAGFMKINYSDPEQKKLFQGTQKLVGILFCFFEAIIYVSSGFVPAGHMVGNQFVAYGFFNPVTMFLILQLAFGAIIIMYLDEIVSKYGIGSGVGLFIAAGVSFTIIWRMFAWNGIGVVPFFVQGLMGGKIEYSALFPLLFTILVFLIVVYAESMKIEVPLTFGKIRGYGTRYPLKFLYVSNIPVILAAALFANVQLWGVAMNGMGLPLLGSFDNSNQPLPGGLAYYLQSPGGALTPGTSQFVRLTQGDINMILNIVVYTVAMLILCVLFGKFWVNMSNMDSKAVAGQLQHIGLYIPGFRRDPRVMEHVLERYIPIVTVLGAIAVGLLAVFADLTGALGSGTGILLTVGILYKFYEELAAEQAFETMPGLRSIMGGE